MNTTLRNLVAKEGMAAVLATLRTMVNEEVTELEDIGGEDAVTAIAMEEVASLILQAAAKYQEIVTGAPV